MSTAATPHYVVTRVYGLRVVRWEDAKAYLGEARYERFQEWMTGQTCLEEGAYAWDFAAFLRGAPVTD